MADQLTENLTSFPFTVLSPIFNIIPKSSISRCTSLTLMRRPGAPRMDIIPAALNRLVCWLVGIFVSISNRFIAAERLLRLTWREKERERGYDSKMYYQYWNWNLCNRSEYTQHHNSIHCRVATRKLSLQCVCSNELCMILQCVNCYTLQYHALVWYSCNNCYKSTAYK